MKIGIVSAQKHCKTHLRQLTKDGHDVYCLGARPQRIPPSYDVIIVRIASMRHCEAYKEWAKTTGRPVIYEDGLSGARRELAKIQTTAPKMATAALSVSEVRGKMVEWGEALIEARPTDRRSEVARHLAQTLRQQFPSMASDSKALVASVVAQLFLTPEAPLPVTAPPAEVVSQYTVVPDPPPSAPAAEPAQESTPMKTKSKKPADPVTPYPTQSVPWETVKDAEGWCKVYSPAKLDKAYDQAQHMIETLSDRTVDKFVSAWTSRAEKGKPLQRDLLRTLKPLVKGKPLAFAMFVYLVMPHDHQVQKQALYTTYQDITDRGSDTRLAYAVGWYLNRGIQTTAMPEATVVPPLNEPPRPAPETNGAGARKRLDHLLKTNQAAVESVVATVESFQATAPELVSDSDRNTEDILAVIEDFADFKNQFQKWKSLMISQADTTEQNLEEAIKANLDPRTNVKLAQMEKRIGDLFATQLRNFKHEVNRLVEETREEVLVDLATLRKEIGAARLPQEGSQQAPSRPDNPLGELEQVKAMLKGYGFKGTLTIEIE